LAVLAVLVVLALLLVLALMLEATHHASDYSQPFQP